MTARIGRDPGEIYQALAREVGDATYARIDEPADRVEDVQAFPGVRGRAQRLVLPALGEVHGQQLLEEARVARLASLGFSPANDPTVAVDGPGPTLFFQEVPERRTSKNRLHLDIEVSDRLAEVERLTASGATVIGHFDTWTVLQDPEENEFCLSDQR